MDDAWEAVLWIAKPETAALLTVDNITKLAVAGSSAGANLAAVMCQRTTSRAKSMRHPVRFSIQLLSVPITDNTADVASKDYPSWNENQHAPGLPADKMLWFRKHYLPDKKDWDHPDVSPLLWEGPWFKLPPACILTGELDILRDEGVAFGKKLSEAGVQADVHVFKRQPHPFIAMDGVLQDGAEAVTVLCRALCRAMYPDA